uniref:Interferon gamma 1 n=1 Tax=Stegastes partitus TaxID=144197 RepID=A0A3B5B7W8_9TELE
MVAVARMALCLSLWLLICQVRGFYVPEKMNKTIQNLLHHYNSTIRDKFTGKPIFSRDLLHAKREVKTVFMGVVLNTYEKLLGHMLKQLPTAAPPSADSTTAGAGSAAGLQPDAKANLTYILDQIHVLKEKRFHEETKFLKQLHDLKPIEVDDSLVQAKALWELPRLFQEASEVADSNRQRRRRRRQTKSKTRLGA